MRPLIKACVPFVFLSCGVAVPFLRAAEEPAEDLHPLDPVSRRSSRVTSGCK